MVRSLPLTRSDEVCTNFNTGGEAAADAGTGRPWRYAATQRATTSAQKTEANPQTGSVALCSPPCTLIFAG